jgi:secretion/DNA translocation related TadE-like protein
VLAERWAVDRGSGTVLALGVIGALVALGTTMFPLSTVYLARQSLSAAADAAALAAADVAVGITSGYPCDAAAAAASANGARLSECRLDGLVATVTASASILGFALTARATAGPPSGVVD